MEFIALLVFILIAVLAAFLFNAPASDRHKHWYRPWLLAIVFLLALVFSTKAVNKLSAWIPWDFVFLEMLYVSIIGLIWIIIKFFLRKFKLDDQFLQLLRSINKDPYEEKSKGISNYLAWPYYLLPPGTILLRAGSGIYRRVFLSMAIILGLIYALSLLFGRNISLEVQTGFGIIPSLLFIEWYLYLSSDKKIFESIGEPPPLPQKVIPEFDKLWERFVSTFHNGFNSAFIKLNDQIHDKVQLTNDKIIEDLVNQFNNGGCDIIASDLNLVQSFYKFRRILMDSLNKGGNILILVEIPVHFKILPGELNLKSSKQNEEIDLAEIFAEFLSREMKKQDPATSEILKLHYYDARKIADSEKHRILLTSVNNMLNDNLLQSHWIKNIELLIVINFQDSCLSTISEDRQFSLLLDRMNPNYRTLIFTPYRNEIHAGLEHTWLLNRIEERRFSDEIHALQSYFIGFNFEKWRENWNAVARPLTGHPVYSGLELAILPMTCGVDHIHLFETAYTEAFEGREDLAVHENKIDPQIADLTRSEILKSIYVNPLPVPVFIDGVCSPYNRHHFSIIYDSENNAPKLYARYNVLGMEQNFSIIVSRPHLFREYFSNNFIYFLHTPIEAIQPQLSKSYINLAIQLLVLLNKEGVSKDRILQLFHQYGIIEYNSVHEVISELFLAYFNFNIKDNFTLRYLTSEGFADGAYKLDETFILDKQSIEDWSGFDFMKSVSIIDNAGNQLFNISQNLVFQNFLPGQTIAFNGRPYLFEHFSYKDSTLQVRKTESRNTLFYKPVYNVTITGPYHESDISSSQTFFRKGKGYRITLSLKEAEVAISTSSFYEFVSAYVSHQAADKQPVCHNLDINDQNMVKRKYQRGRFLELNWELLPEFKEHKDVFTSGLQLLLYESLRVFYPYYHQYLIIVSDNKLLNNQRDQLPWIFPENSTDIFIAKTSPKDELTLLIIEDSFADLGLLKSLQRNFIYIVKHLFDLLLWYGEENYSNQAGLLKYRENQTDKVSFLNYGMGRSIITDYQMFMKLIEEHLPIDKDILYETATRRQMAIRKGIVECDYCRRPFPFDQVSIMEDGLHRCQECSIDATDTIDQALELFEASKQLYKQHLDIDINKYQFEFLLVTARELHNINGLEFNPTARYDTRQLVGQAWDKEKDKVYIEKGYKSFQTLSIIIHELNHIWEYNELDYKRIEAYPDLSAVIEGLSVWTEVFLLRKAGHGEYADIIESNWANDETKYGKGYRYIKSNYPENPHESLKSEYPHAL